MKTVLSLSVVFSTICLLSCKKEQNGSTGTAPVVQNDSDLRFLFARINGEDFVYNDSGTSYTSGPEGESIFIDGYSYETGESVAVQFMDDFSTGNHAVSAAGNHRIYYNNTACISGTVKIVYHANDSIAGRFSGVGTDAETGEEVIISDGEFATRYSH